MWDCTLDRAEIGSEAGIDRHNRTIRPAGVARSFRKSFSNTTTYNFTVVAAVQYLLM